MKIKEFREKYKEKGWSKTVTQEDRINEFYLSMKDMKKDLEHAVTKYERGKMTVEDAYKLVDDTIYTLLYANQLLRRMIKKQR